MAKLLQKPPMQMVDNFKKITTKYFTGYKCFDSGLYLTPCLLIESMGQTAEYNIRCFYEILDRILYLAQLKTVSFIQGIYAYLNYEIIVDDIIQLDKYFISDVSVFSQDNHILLSKAEIVHSLKE